MIMKDGQMYKPLRAQESKSRNKRKLKQTLELKHVQATETTTANDPQTHPMSLLGAVYGARDSQSLIMDMEALWKFCQEFPQQLTEYKDFKKLAQSYLPRLDPQTALNMVQTWEIGQKKQSIRELIQRDPDMAMFLCSRLNQDMVLTLNDSEIASLSTMKPAERLREIKRLIKQNKPTQS